MPYGWIVEETIFDVTAYAVVQVPDVAIVVLVITFSRVSEREKDLLSVWIEHHEESGESATSPNDMFRSEQCASVSEESPF